MKVFEYDPDTGRRGKQIDTRPVASWGDCSLAFLAQEGNSVPYCRIPNLPQADWTAHIDGGIERYSKARGIEFVSYKHDTKWICFCTGQIQCGDQDYWDWWILPPREAYDANTDYIRYQQPQEASA